MTNFFNDSSLSGKVETRKTILSFEFLKLIHEIFRPFFEKKQIKKKKVTSDK